MTRTCQRAEEQLEPTPVPEDHDGWIAIAMQEVRPDKVKSQVTDALATFLDMMEEVVEELFWAATLRAQGGICTVM